MRSPDIKSHWWMVQASWAIAIAVKGSKRHALRIAREYGRLDQMSDKELNIFPVTQQTSEALKLIRHHPLYGRLRELEFILEGDNPENQRLVPLIPEGILHRLPGTRLPSSKRIASVI